MSIKYYSKSIYEVWNDENSERFLAYFSKEIEGKKYFIVDINNNKEIHFKFSKYVSSIYFQEEIKKQEETKIDLNDERITDQRKNYIYRDDGSIYSTGDMGQ